MVKKVKLNKKVKLKKERGFGEPLKVEDLSFGKLTLRDKLLVMVFGFAEDMDISLDFVYHPYRYKTIPTFKATQNSLYSVVSRSVKVGDIKKVRKKDEVYLQITAVGKEYLKREFPVFRWQNEKWDGLWRIVAYDIEESQRDTRDLLRWKLEELGFAMLQRSLWMTPHNVTRPLREFLESEQLTPEVYVLEAKGLFAGDDRLLAAQLWPLKELNLAYKDWLERARKTGAGKKPWDKRTEFKEEFLGILKADPCLPRKLLPKNWLGERAVERFRKL